MFCIFEYILIYPTFHLTPCLRIHTLRLATFRSTLQLAYQRRSAMLDLGKVTEKTKGEEGDPREGPQLDPEF